LIDQKGDLTSHIRRSAFISNTNDQHSHPQIDNAMHFSIIVTAAIALAGYSAANPVK
jgi:hypothetical protein